MRRGDAGTNHRLPSLDARAIFAIESRSLCPAAQDITVWLIGSESHKARPDLTDDSGFWLRVRAADALPFVAAFKASPAVFHEFLIEQRVGKETRISRLNAQIVKIEEGPAETRLLILPDIPVP